MPVRTRTIILKASGMEVTISMPNLYQLVASHAKTPNPMTGRIIELLEGYGLVGASTPKQREKLAQDTILGVVELASLCLERPKLILDRAPVESDGEVGPEAFAYSDWTELLGLFRSDPQKKAANHSEPGATSEAVPDGA